jgi:hypothetical protein
MKLLVRDAFIALWCGHSAHNLIYGKGPDVCVCRVCFSRNNQSLISFAFMFSFPVFHFLQPQTESAGNRPELQRLMFVDSVKKN